MENYVRNCAIGPENWRGLKKPNDHLLVSKKVEKFELDRSSWSCYQNFDHMYNCISYELVDAGITDKLFTPVWMNATGEEV